MEKECKKHGKTTWYQKKGSTGVRCRKCMVDDVTKRRKKIKQLAVDYKGGKCELCGYNKSIEALQFHHLDPEIKDFNIGHKGHSRSWERVKKEIDKCVCLCANCHAEVHAGITIIGDKALR